MNRKTYWLYVAGFFFVTFLIGASSAGLPEAEWRALEDSINVVAIPIMLILGVKRCEDIGCSKWWGVTAIFLIGLIILGFIPSGKEKL